MNSSFNSIELSSKSVPLSSSHLKYESASLSVSHNEREPNTPTHGNEVSSTHFDERYLGAQIKDSGFVEVRIQTWADRWVSGLFSSVFALQDALACRKDVKGLYCTLNRPNTGPAYVAPNRFAVANEVMALKNAHMVTTIRLPLDFDPIRPVGVNSTDIELASALKSRDMVVAALMSRGFPLPALGMSGNGAHAIFRCELPLSANRCEVEEIVSRFYRGVSDRFKDDFDAMDVNFDQSVKNPGRILRLYGSRNCKGPDERHRPQRVSKVILPPKWQKVPQKLIRAVGDNWSQKFERTIKPTKQAAFKGYGDYLTLDVVSWFMAHGLYRKPIHDPGGKAIHWVTCPWAHEHTTPSTVGDAVIFEGNGSWPGFHCKHGHCDGRGIQDVMLLLGDADYFCAAEWRPA